MPNINPRGEALEHAMYLSGIGTSVNTIACVFEKGETFIIALFKALSVGAPDLCPRRITAEESVCSHSEVAAVLTKLSEENQQPAPPIFFHRRSSGRWPFEWQLVDEKLAPLLIGGISIVAGYNPI